MFDLFGKLLITAGRHCLFLLESHLDVKGDENDIFPKTCSCLWGVTTLNLFIIVNMITQELFWVVRYLPEIFALFKEVLNL